ncbi:MAG: hypothetical protein AAF998_23610 [Bacteroidota bacterium]
MFKRIFEIPECSVRQIQHFAVGRKADPVKSIVGNQVLNDSVEKGDFTRTAVKVEELYSPKFTGQREAVTRMIENQRTKIWLPPGRVDVTHRLIATRNASVLSDEIFNENITAFVMTENPPAFSISMSYSSHMLGHGVGDGIIP